MNPESRIQNPESNDYAQFLRDGFQIIRNAITTDEADTLASELSARFEDQQTIAKSRIGGLRNLIRDNAHVARLAVSAKMFSILKNATESPLFPVRAIFFDKTADTNWLVPWHQDLAVAVKKRIETSGFTGWSVKEGVTHVHPPVGILETMIALRLHLDDCSHENGALKVIPSSHSHGKLKPEEITKHSEQTSITCEASKGDALLMRPLLVHASSPSSNPSHRRVLHIEYASHELPNGLEWFER